MQRRPLLTLGIALVLATAAAGPVASHPSHGGTYTGTIEGGGTIQFEVNADGTAVTSYTVTGFPAAPCATSIDEMGTGNYPIGPHPAHGWGTMYIQGTFPALQQAQGTYRFHSAYPSCTTEPRNWTASTTAPPPPACNDGEDNDGDGTIDYPNDPGCADALGNDETDVVVTPPPLGPAPLPQPTPGAGPTPGDVTPPALGLGGATLQRLGRGGTLAVRTSCGAEPCAVTATGKLSARGKTFKLRSAKASLAAGGRATLRLALSRKALNAVRSALRKRLPVRARISVAAVDAAGNKATAGRTIRVRR